MHSIGRRLRILVGTAVVGFGGLSVLPAPAAGAAPLQQAPAEELHDVTAEEQTLLADLAEIESDVARLDGEIATITAAEAEVLGRLEAAEATLASAQAHARAAEERHADAQRSLDRAEDRLRDEAISLYVGGAELRQHMAVAVLDANSLNDVYAAEVYGRELLDQQESVVDAYDRARAATATTRNQAREAERAAERQRREITDERDALEGERQRREQLRAEQQTRQAEQQALLRDLQARRMALEAVIAAATVESDGVGRELQALQASEPLVPPTPGSFVHPVPTNTEVGSPFGMRMHPILGYERLHRGIDFGCSAGETIVAAANGVVVIAGPRGGYGNAVVIDHGGKVATLYGHRTAHSRLRLDRAVDRPSLTFRDADRRPTARPGGGAPNWVNPRRAARS
jgi:peptidoglycan DL-endopeptidase CwlO